MKDGRTTVSLSEQQLTIWAERIDTAHQTGQLLRPISSEINLSNADAYEIQRLLTARRLATGATRVGWKLGYTSAAMRRQMRISEPNLGPLTSAMLLVDGEPPGLLLAQPRVEPEIALRMIADLPADCSVAVAAAAVGTAHAALEIVDSVWVDYQFTLPDNTADGSSAAAVVVGPALRDLDLLDLLQVTMYRNDVKVGAGQGADALGHPLQALCWLARALAEHNEIVRKGDIVITGGLTPAIPMRPGDVCRAVFGEDVQVATHLPKPSHQALADPY